MGSPKVFFRDVSFYLIIRLHGGTMGLLETVQFICPYCGERVEVVVDCSIGFQEYVEDCHVCCKPIHLAVSVNREGEPSIEARQEDE